jgi:hypothetical protein
MTMAVSVAYRPLTLTQWVQDGDVVQVQLLDVPGGAKPGWARIVEQIFRLRKEGNEAVETEGREVALMCAVCKSVHDADGSLRIGGCVRSARISRWSDVVAGKNVRKAGKERSPPRNDAEKETLKGVCVGREKKGRVLVMRWNADDDDRSRRV